MDRTSFKSVLVLSIISTCFCQYYQQQQQEQYHTPPPPQILSHKQAQSHDGGFKYAFAAENGLAQGETIAPDGSRTGGYTYVDPHGRKISVKYTAGKEGFKILEGDHIPRAPLPIQQAHTGFAQPLQYGGGGGGGFQQRSQDDGQYRPEIYEKPYQVQQYSAPAPYSAPISKPAYEPPRYPAPLLTRPESTNTLEAYNDAPGKPYSFGKGFSFEFGG